MKKEKPYKFRPVPAVTPEDIPVALTGIDVESVPASVFTEVMQKHMAHPMYDYIYSELNDKEKRK